MSSLESVCRFLRYNYSLADLALSSRNIVSTEGKLARRFVDLHRLLTLQPAVYSQDAE